MFIYVFEIFIKGLFMSLAEKLIKEFEEKRCFEEEVC